MATTIRYLQDADSHWSKLSDEIHDLVLNCRTLRSDPRRDVPDTVVRELRTAREGIADGTSGTTQSAWAKQALGDLDLTEEQE
jgi:hypothetical protein